MSAVRFRPSPHDKTQHAENERVGFLVFTLRQEFIQEAPNIEALKRQKYPHKKAKLVKAANRWYVEFHVYDHLTGKLKRKRFYNGINDIEDLTKRELFAKNIVKDINVSIQYWSINEPDKEELSKPIKQERIQLITAIENVIDLKYNNYTDTRKTSHTYASNARMFIDYCKNIGLYHFDVNHLKKQHVQAYIDYMVTREHLSGQTIENRISTMRAIFNHLIKRNVIFYNPFSDDLDKPRIIKSKRNHAYSPDQIEKIKKEALNTDPGIWIVCQFIYYTYMRPVEIGRLKVSNILLEKNQIYIAPHMSKNRTEAFIFMPPALKSIMINHIKDANSPNDYLFTKNFKPGTKQVGYNFFGNRYRAITKKLHLDSFYTLYSWKHTGVVNAYKNGVDIKAIQMQCRHASIGQTDTYLKSLGFVENESFRTGIPKI